MDSRLRHAVAVARHASFSRAAEAVGVTQSAVTKSVADLERQVGYAIFHRTSKGAMATEEGRDFLDRAARLMSEADDLLSNRRHGTDPFKGVLRVGVYPGSLEWMLTAGLTALIRKHPGVRLEINTGTSERGLHLLRSGDIDIAVGMTAAFETWSELHCATIAELSTHCFVRIGHPLLERKIVTLDDIARYDFVSFSMSAPYADAVRDLYLSRGIDPAEQMHIVDFYPLVRSIVSQSNAIGVIADTTDQSGGFSRNFAILEQPVVFPAVAVCCATRAKWPVKPAAKALISMLRAAAATQADARDQRIGSDRRSGEIAR